MSAPEQPDDAAASPPASGGQEAQEAVSSREPDTAWPRWLFQDHPQAMLIYDVEDVTVLDVNTAFTLVAGYTRDDVVGRPLASLLVPDEVPALIEMLETDVRPGRAPHRDGGSWRAFKKDGTVIVLRVTAHNTVYDGRPAAVVMASDITERLRAERERDALLVQLRQESAQKAAILEQMGDGVLVADAAGRIVLANRAVRALLDYDAPEWPDLALGPLPWTLYDLSGRCLDDTARPFTRALAGETVRAEYRIVTATGRELWAWITAGPLRDECDAITGLVWLGRETTEDHDRRAREAEGEKLRALGQMASGVAHDLNQYLGLVAGYADIVLRELAEAQPDLTAVREAVDVIARAAMDGSRTVNRLQAFARPAEDGPPEVVNVGELLREVTALTAPRWQSTDDLRMQPISLVVEADGDLPIRGWPAALREAFSNLVANAVDAMPNGGSIRLAAHRDNDRIVATVTDTGVGIPQASLGHLFEPFFTTKGTRGTGLGLAIVYGIVERHQGQITVASQPGRGTTVTLTFPVVAVGASSTLPPAPARPPRSGLRILAVDDEPAITRMVAMMLRPHGYQVTVAPSAEAALALIDAASQPFDAILSDLGLGDGMDGWGLLDEVRTRSPRSRFILSTGWGTQLNPSDVIARGGHGLLPKPYRLSDLLAALTAP